MKPLDMRGQPCPIPVVKARKALQAGEDVAIDVDNEIAVQNLRKMADGEGYAFSAEALAKDHYRAFIQRGEADAVAMHGDTLGEVGEMTVLITSDALGSGSEELGRLLMKGYLFSLTELPVPPARLIFLNGGAKLTTSGANTVPDLLSLQEKGAEIYTCGTCANYYGISDALAVGQIADMMRISRMLADAGHLVTL